jgi:hypothetical protein
MPKRKTAPPLRCAGGMCAHHSASRVHESFNPYEEDPQRLVGDAMALFEASGCLPALGVDASVLHNFVCAVRDGYRANAYHNWCAPPAAGTLLSCPHPLSKRVSWARRRHGC